MWSAPWLVFRKWGDMVFKKGISICWFQNQHGRSQFLNFWTSYLEQEFDMYPGSNHFYNAIYQTCCRNGLPLSSSTLLLHWIWWGPVTEHMLSVIYIRTTTCQNVAKKIMAEMKSKLNNWQELMVCTLRTGEFWGPTTLTMIVNKQCAMEGGTDDTMHSDKLDYCGVCTSEQMEDNELAQIPWACALLDMKWRCHTLQLPQGCTIDYSYITSCEWHISLLVFWWKIPE